MDAFATPFVQGRLRKKPLKVEIRTECACCARPMTLEVDSDLNIAVRDQGASPLIFIPEVDFETLPDPSIINAF